MTHDVNVLGNDELAAAHNLFFGSLHFAPSDEAGLARGTAAYEPGRVLGINDGGVLAATAMSFATSTVVPGGAVVPTAGVSRVGVRADKTRRGFLSAMMRAQLDDVAARGEAFASLRASEARIYGRFGYGVATRGRDLRVRSSGRGWRPTAPAGGTVRLLERDDVIATVAELHERIALQRAGQITRRGEWWDKRFARRIADHGHLIAAVHTGPDGDDGYVLASVAEGHENFTERTVNVDELNAADVAATAGLWRFVLGLDLIGTATASLRPLDEPLELMLADPRDCAVTEIGDETWLRIVDVPTALAARSYGPGTDPVLIAVHDPMLEKNAGVYRITGDSAERVGPLGGPITPELECDVAALAMAYLGDRLPSQLVATGWWSAPDLAAVARADALFATGVVPWCGTFF
ncbi:GNAT family N-acetyltransferase [Pseudonocardia sp. TRM90224]|uniref:GNAT family N-acetyltransferase n=1 Tax=Pseudonocardia sp. TRM90224 TaxID=2812678 RepID=UPI001E5AB26F|nr:GNAT family N-acetyltransferase [Pseudonocardia sp. TRM90224]